MTKRTLYLTLLAILLVIFAAGTTYFFYKRLGVARTNQTDVALQQLQDGNERFLSGKSQKYNYDKQIKKASQKNQPKAVVLNCMESKAIPAVIFDQGIGDVYTLRIAGNVINPDILGSMELATRVDGAKIIVVLGHTHCAVDAAACQGDKLGNLTSLLQQIEPAVKTAQKSSPKSNCNDETLINAIAKQNVLNMVQQIPQQSTVIANLVKQGKVKIVGGMYDESTGEVTFFNKMQSSN